MYTKPRIIDIVRSPIHSIRQWYNNVVAVNDFKVTFSDRNDSRVVIPFLSGLGAEYVLIDKLLIVCEDNLFFKLEDLGFKIELNDLDYTELYTTPISQNLIEESTRFYHIGFNIEIYLHLGSKWSTVTTAATISKDLKGTNKTFNSVYDSLYNITYNDN